MTIKTYPGAMPPDWDYLLSTKRKGPLRTFKAWDRLSDQQLALIPSFCYTAITLSKMTWPQLAAPIERPFAYVNEPDSNS